MYLHIDDRELLHIKIFNKKWIFQSNFDYKKFIFFCSLIFTFWQYCVTLKISKNRDISKGGTQYNENIK